MKKAANKSIRLRLRIYEGTDPNFYAALVSNPMPIYELLTLARLGFKARNSGMLGVDLPVQTTTVNTESGIRVSKKQDVHSLTHEEVDLVGFMAEHGDSLGNIFESPTHQ